MSTLFNFKDRVAAASAPPTTSLTTTDSYSAPDSSSNDREIKKNIRLKPMATAYKSPASSSSSSSSTIFNRPSSILKTAPTITSSAAVSLPSMYEPSKHNDDDEESNVEDKKRDGGDRRDEEEDDDDEPRTSRYKISNLIALFNKSNIDLETIFTYKKRVMLVQVAHEGFSYFIYIPSKYEMYIDRSLGIAIYDLTDDDEEQEEDQDTLFYSKLPIENLRRLKKSKSKNLARFLPLVSESPVKMIYIDQYFLCYINRHNEVDSMMLLSPFAGNMGYYYMTDLEFFFKNLTRLPDELNKFEQALTVAVYDKLTVEVDSAKQSLSKAMKLVEKMNPKLEKKKFQDDIAKLNKYYKVDEHRSKAKEMLIKMRNRNLKKMFEIENVTYVMKEFK